MFEENGGSELIFDMPDKTENNEWKEYRIDQDLWDEVEKDTKRTRSEMHFFQSSTGLNNNFPLI